MGALSPVQLLLMVAVVGVVFWLLSRARKPSPAQVESNRLRPDRTSKIVDPYAPPQADEDESTAREPRLELAVASQSARFLNSVIDSIVLAVVSGGAKNPAGQLLLMFGYYWGLEAFFGATLGKLVTRTRVVAVDGRPATAWQILGRTLIRFIPVEALSFMSSNPVGWHDRWSNTRVVPR